MFSTLILSMALAFVAVAQTLSRVRCRSLECIRTTEGWRSPTGSTVDEPPKIPKQTIKRPTLSSLNCRRDAQRTDGMEMMNVSPSHSTM